MNRNVTFSTFSLWTSCQSVCFVCRRFVHCIWLINLNFFTHLSRLALSCEFNILDDCIGWLQSLSLQKEAVDCSPHYIFTKDLKVVAFAVAEDLKSFKHIKNRIFGSILTACWQVHVTSCKVNNSFRRFIWVFHPNIQSKIGSQRLVCSIWLIDFEIMKAESFNCI